MTNIQAYRGLSINVASEEAEGHMDGVDAMATQHTPGPWVVAPTSFDVAVIASNSSDSLSNPTRGLVATVCCAIEAGRTRYEAEANARLIASAPETARERDELREKFLTASNEAHRQRIQREQAETKCGELLAALKKAESWLNAASSPKLLGQPRYLASDIKEIKAAIACAEAK